MVKLFKNMAAQGDLCLRRIDTLPKNVESVKSAGGVFILAHSETGHNHVVMERPSVKMYKDSVDQFRAFLHVTQEAVDLEHLRDYDTHETLRIEPGIYEVRRQREYTPEGFRKAQD